MSQPPELFATVDLLIDRWRERRALKLLRIILRAYPMEIGLTDEWHELYKALRLIRSLYDQQLPEEESNLLGEAIVIIGRALYPGE